MVLNVTDLEHDIAEAIWLGIKLKQKKLILSFISRPNEYTNSYKTWSNYMDDAISSEYAEKKEIDKITRCKYG